MACEILIKLETLSNHDGINNINNKGSHKNTNGNKISLLIAIMAHRRELRIRFYTFIFENVHNKHNTLLSWQMTMKSSCVKNNCVDRMTGFSTIILLGSSFGRYPLIYHGAFCCKLIRGHEIDFFVFF